MKVSDFEYHLPAEAIAQIAIEPRDTSRLLVLDGLHDRLFSDLPQILSSGDLIVVNRTRVRAARLVGARRPGGGKTEVLLTQRGDVERWRALIRPASKVHVGTIIDCGELEISVLSEPVAGLVTVEVLAPGDVEATIARVGTVPLPPYFHGSLDDPDRYQTIFADTIGSSAAPTAALHFTPRLVSELTDSGLTFAEVDLEVGIDTFRPMSSNDIEDHVIHSERIEVGEGAAEALARTRANGGRVVAIGTTVVRTLESVANDDGTISPYSGSTDLFITPGYRPRVVDALITNFHAPRTTLLVLLSALIGDRWKDAYAHALDDGYRFLSFGDAMYVEIDR